MDTLRIRQISGIVTPEISIEGFWILLDVDLRKRGDQSCMGTVSTCRFWIGLLCMGTVLLGIGKDASHASFGSLFVD